MKTYSKVSLRIMGDLDIESLTKEFGIKPSYSHKKGEIGPIQTVFDSDMWSVSAPLDDDLPLNNHLVWLVERLESQYHILKGLKTYAKIDVFCSFTSGEQGGFSLSPKALSIFHDLEINMEVSLILSEA